MGKLGVIGGMGPQATELLYQKIIDMTDAACDQEHLDMIILNHASMPDRTQAIRSGQTDEVLRLLTEDAKMLEQNGVDAIAVPCNTSHYFYDRLQEAVRIPVIHMVRETVTRVASRLSPGGKVGILATDGTVFSGLYANECEKAGLVCVTPDEKTQKLVMKIIYEQIKAGEKGSLDDFGVIDTYLKRNGCEAAILACTELSCFKAFHALDRFYTDALDVLCYESIRRCGGKIKSEYTDLYGVNL